MVNGDCFSEVFSFSIKCFISCVYDIDALKAFDSPKNAAAQNSRTKRLIIYRFILLQETHMDNNNIPNTYNPQGQMNTSYPQQGDAGNMFTQQNNNMFTQQNGGGNMSAHQQNNNMFAQQNGGGNMLSQQNNNMFVQQQNAPGNYAPQPFYNNPQYMDPNAKKGSRRIFIAAMAITAVAFIAVMSIFIFKFVNRNVKKGDGKMSNKVYSVEDIRVKYGYDDMYSREYEYDGVHYIQASPNGYTSSKYYTFYIFDSAKEAKDYFEDMRSWYFSRITYEEENHLEGWISGICDADEKDSVELIDNYIIFEELELIGYDGF